MEFHDEELREIVRLLKDRTGRRELGLVRLKVACRWPVYRGETPGDAPVFVKVARPEEARNTLALLSSAGPCELLPRPVVAEPIAFGEYSVLCLEWKESSTLFAEEMSEVQLKSFVAGCAELSRSLASVAVPLVAKAEDDPLRQYALLSDYAKRHPIGGRLLRGILEIPAAERTYGARTLVPIHGDFQPKNYGFAGDRMTAVYDFEEVRPGLACEDAAYAFTERCRHLCGKRHRRLVLNFLEMMRRSPWPAEEWRIAVNHCRLRIAARRLDKHPDGFFVALDIRRRDRPLRRLYDIICAET